MLFSFLAKRREQRERRERVQGRKHEIKRALRKQKIFVPSSFDLSVKELEGIRDHVDLADALLRSLR